MILFSGREATIAQAMNRVGGWAKVKTGSSNAMTHDIAIEPAHRRTGIALALKHHLDAWARDHGAFRAFSTA